MFAVAYLAYIFLAPCRHQLLYCIPEGINSLDDLLLGNDEGRAENGKVTEEVAV